MIMMDVTPKYKHLGKESLMSSARLSSDGGYSKLAPVDSDF